jgi:octaprenyl-diphosphate synthase
MDKIQQLMHDDLLELDLVIRQDLDSNIVLIKQISEYIIASGGKRIRPLLCLLCGRIAGYKNGNLLHKMSAMIEYIHTATLLHDDVVDESGLRRGRQTANAIFGNASSILVGDFIYTRAFQMMVESNNIRLLKIMADSTNKISEGEVLQLLNIGRSDLTEAEYFKVIEHKTATLFVACAKVAAIVANSPIDIEMALTNYAINLGNAFQIVDDLLDYTGNSGIMGKNVGDDLLEGKVTLPLIYLLQQNEMVSKPIKYAIENPQIANIEDILILINNSGAIDYCKQIVQSFMQKAKDSLAIFPDSNYKQSMLDLAQLSVSRIK